MTRRRLAWAVAWALPALACRPPASSPAGTPAVNVVVSIPPQAYLLERIGHARVRAHVVLAPGQSPHTFQPTPQQVTRLSAARLYFTIGLPFERTIVQALADSAPRLEVVDSTAGITRRRMEPGAHEHDERGTRAHDDPGARGHDHPGAPEDADSDAPGRTHLVAGRPPDDAESLDPHVWLDPRLAARMADNMRAALGRADPAHAAEFDAGCAALQRDLADLHARLLQKLAPFRGGAVLVFHPAFGYFTDAYGLEQVPVEVEGKSPGARQIAALVARARAAGARVLFTQPQFSSQAAAAVAAEIGAEVVTIDPLARDYLANMEAMADAIAHTLRRSSD